LPLVKSLHPDEFQIVRSDTTFLPDSIPYAVTKIEKVPYNVFVYKDKNIDTVISDISIFADSTGIVLKYIGEPKIVTKVVTNSYHILSEEQRLTDSINVGKQEKAQLIGRIEQQEKQINQEIKEREGWMIKFWLLLSAVLIIHGILLYVKFKAKIPLP
jgi:hypothetical protein